MTTLENINNSYIQERNPNLQPLAPTRNRFGHNLKAQNLKWSMEEDNLLKQLASQNEPKWSEISKHFPNKTPHQVSDRWAKVLNPNLQKGSWTGAEDLIIVDWVRDNGPKGWGALAEKLPGRISKQCRERYHNHLCPTVLKSDWTQKEDEILIECQHKWGNKWAKIASLLPGRTDNSVKNRWNSSLKRRLERLQQGHDPSIRRGRKPKRESEAPNNDDIPKPDFSIVINEKSQDIVPTPNITELEDSNSSAKYWFSSPGMGINSPMIWPNESPFNTNFSHFINSEKPDVSEILPPKFD